MERKTTRASKFLDIQKVFTLKQARMGVPGAVNNLQKYDLHFFSGVKIGKIATSVRARQYPRFC